MKQAPKSRLRNDLLLGGVLLAAALCALLLLRLQRQDGAQVVVSVSGEEVARYALAEDRSVTFSDDAHSNTLIISDGYAWVTDASCPDKLCEQQGRIHYNGEMIVCLPNQLVVEISGGENAAVDFSVG